MDSERIRDRTSDSLFILKSLINKYLHKNKKKLFICFVDFQKAFDSIWRIGLLTKLYKLGIGRNMFNIIYKQLLHTKSAFHHKGMHSDFFDIDKGVRQGDSISPTLFNVFINDISEIFTTANCDPPKLIDTNIGNLLFADDLIILSESADGLQNSLNALSGYCNKWQLTVNTKKTKTMVVQNHPNNKINPFIKYKGQLLENVREYKYLGCIISSNGSLVNCSSDLANKARKALFAIKSYTSNFSQVPVKVACNLFQTLVRPILTYNSEICFMDSYLKFYRANMRASKSNSDIDILSFVDKTPTEKIQLNFIKSTLGAKRCSTNLVVREELKILPVESFIKTQTIIYLSRLNNDKINPILKEAFLLTKKLDNEGTYSWYTYATNVVKETKNDLNQILNCKNITETNRLKDKINLSVKQYYLKLSNNKIASLTDNNKNYLYKYLKNETEENLFYLSHPNKEKRKLITKFRISDHDLLIETGRYKNIPREQRCCTVCNILDDESHFFFNCEINSNLREPFLNTYIKNDLNIISSNHVEKLKMILNPSTPDDIKTVTSFIQQSLELRKGD